MKLNEMETTIKKVAQGKTIASVEVAHNRCKLIFEDLTFIEFHPEMPFGWPKPDFVSHYPVLGARWGKEKKSENSSSN